MSKPTGREITLKVFLKMFYVIACMIGRRVMFNGVRLTGDRATALKSKAYRENVGICIARGFFIQVRTGKIKVP